MRLLLLLIVLTASAIAAEFPAPFNTETAAGGPMTPDQAAASVRTPPGFRVTMFAAEPDVQQPIAIATDSRGRLWVVECYTYAESKVNYDTKLRDRILIFEDADNDGRFDKRTVFWDQGERLTSVELGFGGVWVAAAPHLLFIPDKNGDDIPDGPPEVLLDGWDTGPIRHNIVNGLRWGPDGWLYGRHGILATSLVGTPGTPTAQRTKMNVGIWRFHPTRKFFEVVANGGTNPWGMDWNETGDAFFTNTVTGHLWHLIPGAHYERMYGEDANPHVYQLMGMCADHYHFDTGAGWTKSRAAFDGTVASTSDTLGGGHAHCGCLIYQGEQWPEYWRGKVLTINFHGRRLNVERLERSGSGYVAKHEPDAFFFGDPWFRGIDLIQSADGGVFVADWSDASECHDNDGVHRTSGRIYKITYGKPKLPTALVKSGDLAKLTDGELLKVVERSDQWSAKIARIAMQDRSVPYGETDRFIKPMVAAFDLERRGGVTDRVKQRRWELWMSIGSNFHFEGQFARYLSMYAYYYERYSKTWTEGDLRRRTASLWSIDHPQFENVGYVSGLRESKLTSEQQRLLLSYAQRMDDLPRQWIITDTVKQPGFGTDRNVTLLAWYAIDRCLSLPDSWRSRRFIDEIVRSGKSDLLAQWIARRIFSELDEKPESANAFLSQTGIRLPIPPLAARRRDNPSFSEFQLMNGFTDPPKELPRIISRAKSSLQGMAEGLRGRRQAPKPAAWDVFEKRAASTPELAPLVRELSIIFGDGVALDEIRAIALDAKAEITARRQALQSLIEARPTDLRTICEQSLDVRDLAGVAARGLAHFDDPKIGALLLQKYGGIYAHLRPDAMAALVSRPAWAAMLLDAIANGQIARADLGAYHARQIRAFDDDALTKRLAEVWGEVRETDDAKKALVAKLKSQLTPEILAKADLPAGRALFTQTCAVCHKLHGEGGAFGPDLTGSARELTYLLENITDPSAVVPVDFRMSIVTLKDGRVLTGFVGAKADRAFTLRGLTDTQTIERADVKEMTDSPQSPMPEGILSALDETQVRDLMGYLMGKAQVPLPASIK